MENASKALFMAAGVLVGILILGMLVYLFRAGGRLGERYEQSQSQGQLQLFNSKFEHFNKDCSSAENCNTIMDMVTVTNLAIDTNEENEFNTQKNVEIMIKIGSLELYVRPQESLERNYLFKGSSGTDKIYVYDLLSKDKEDLGISTTMDADDTLSMVDSNMNYKYWFECTDLKYHETTGRVKYMEFELIKNTIDYVAPGP